MDRGNGCFVSFFPVGSLVIPLALTVVLFTFFLNVFRVFLGSFFGGVFSNGERKVFFSLEKMTELVGSEIGLAAYWHNILKEKLTQHNIYQS